MYRPLSKWFHSLPEHDKQPSVERSMIVAAPRCHDCSAKAIIVLFVENSPRRYVMRKTLFSMVLVLLVAVPLVSAHDPRTVAKDFSHSLMVEGAGKLTLTY